MQPWLADLIKNTSGVVVGWGLGLASGLALEWRRRRKRVRDMQTAISREFRELARRLVSVVYLAEGRHVGTNRNLLEWVRERDKMYQGPNTADDMLASVEALLKCSDAELAQLAAGVRMQGPRFFPREEARYAESAVGLAHEFAPDYAVRVLDILCHLSMYNEGRDNGLHYLRLTFTPGVTDENHALAIANADMAEVQLAKRARIIVDKITSLEERYPSR